MKKDQKKIPRRSEGLDSLCESGAGREDCEDRRADGSRYARRAACRAMRSEELAELDVASFSREVREGSEGGNERVSVESSVSGESADGVDCEVVKSD